MSDEQLASFWEAIQVNESLQDKLQDVTNLEDIATIAQAEGFDISASELTEARANLTDEELSQCEAEGIAGGLFCCSGGHRVAGKRIRMDFCCTGEHRKKGNTKGNIKGIKKQRDI